MGRKREIQVEPNDVLGIYYDRARRRNVVSYAHYPVRMQPHIIETPFFFQ